MRLQYEGENDKQTPGDTYIKEIREAITKGREFEPLVAAGAITLVI
jgi:hypothetical protein